MFFAKVVAARAAVVFVYEPGVCVRGEEGVVDCAAEFGRETHERVEEGGAGDEGFGGGFGCDGRP